MATAAARRADLVQSLAGADPTAIEAYRQAADMLAEKASQADPTMAPSQADRIGAQSADQARLEAAMEQRRNPATISQATRNALGELYDRATAAGGPGEPARLPLMDIQPRSAVELRLLGVDPADYVHQVDNYALRHVDNRHGDATTERARGQLPITREDVQKIPEIIANPDSVEYAGKNSKGLDVLRYKKRTNGTVTYLEEMRTGKKALVTNTMWKESAGAQDDAISRSTSPAFTPETFPGTEKPTIAGVEGQAEARIDALPSERFGINRNPGQGGFIDPTILSDIVDAGRRILKRGMDFAGWAGRMISRFGSKVAGYLGHAWNYIRQRPSLSQTAEEIRDSLVNGGNTRKSEPPATDEINADASPEAVAARAMDYLNRNFESLLKEYERRFGNNIDIDKARELFPEYSRSKEARTRYVQSVADPAWKLIDEYYRRKLKDPSIKTVAFTAGGAGSGKSAAEAQIASGEEAPLIFGTTLSNFEGGRRILQRAVNSGKRVVVYYVDRPFAGAWDSVIDRAVETGRPVSLDVAARQHANAPGVSRSLAEYFGKKVDWKAIDNSRGKGEAVNATITPVWNRPNLQHGDLAEYAVERLKKVYEQRRGTKAAISPGLYRALGGR